MVSMASTNVFTADQHIATLEQGIFALRNAKRTFDGVESQPAPVEKSVAMTQPPVHPFTNIKETSYQPPHKCNFAVAPAKPAEDKEPAYHYVASIQNPCTVIDVYKLMQAPLITLSPEELFAISPEVCNQLCEAIMPK
jgi:hypothetical protein